MSGAAPAVSVVMTAYNRAPLIAASIESVLAQRFTDFELLIVDDGSADATATIARGYQRGDARVRVVVNDRNLGDYPNRNHAASLARGRFLKYHDSDDLMYPHCLETMVPLLEAEPRAAFGISSAWAWPGGPVPMLLSPRDCYRREFLGLGLFMVGPACGLFRTDVFRQLGGFPDHGVYSDYLFWMRACQRHSALLLPADLFWYRLHPGQELRSAAAERQYAGMAGPVWRELASDACPLEGDELERARRHQTWTVTKQSWRDVKAGRLPLAWHRLRHCGLGPFDWLRYLRRPRRDALAGTPLDGSGQYLVPSWLRPPAAPPRP
jgi:hypothetical protein